MAAKFALLLCVFAFIGAQNVFGNFPSILDDTNMAYLYDTRGAPVLLNSYPWYSSYNVNYQPKLYTNWLIYQRIAQYSQEYNIPSSYLWQLYYLSYSNFPYLSTDKYLRLTEGLAKAIRDERLRDILNPFDSVTPNTFSSLDTLSGYFAPDFPEPYLYTFCYLNSLIPPLSPAAQNDISNAVYQNVPPTQKPKADSLIYQLGTSIRYWLASELQFYSNYY